MFKTLRDLSLSAKLSLLGAGGVLVVAAVLVSLAVWQSGQYNRLAQGEVDELIDADLDHIAEGVYNLVQTENEAVLQQVNGNLNLLRHVIADSGGLSLAKETVAWQAVNQFTGKTVETRLPKMLLGGRWLGMNADPSVETVGVDMVNRLMGESVTIFQRMDDRGDMLRVATTIKTGEGRRAVGTYIPAVNPDGFSNPVIAAALKGETYRGRAFVVNAWYITAYEPLRDGEGKVIGMLYVGVAQKSVESRVRQAVLHTRVGRTGYVYILEGKGKERGHYVISQKGERDGEDIWEQKDSDGRYVIQEIINTAVGLKPGKLGTERYRWQNPGEAAPRWKMARLAYFAPWDWVVGVGVSEDELQGYRAVLSRGRAQMTRIMGLAGLACALALGFAGVFVAWTIARPVRQMTKVAETIIKGDLEQVVEVHSHDEIGVLAETFNFMTGKLKRTMESLRESEEEYRNIFENALEGIFQTSIEGRVLRANSGLARILGYDSPGQVETALTDLRRQLYVCPEERDAIVAAILEQGVVLGQEVRFHRKDGHVIWVLLSARMTRPAEGAPFLQGFVTDITEHKQIEGRLETAKTQLEDIVEFLPDATFIVDGDKKVIEWNRAIEELTGVPKKDIVGQDHYAAAVPFYGYARPFLMDLLDVDDAELAEKYCAVKRKGNSLCAEVFTPALYAGKGAYVWAVACPLFNSLGEKIGTIESIRDITERKRAEEALRRSEENLRVTLASIGDAVIATDIAGNVTRMNPVAERLTGWAFAEAERKPLDDIFHVVNAETREAVPTPTEKVLACGEIVGLANHALLIARDGAEYQIADSGAPIRDDAGKIIGVVLVFRNVTEEYAIQARLRQSQKMDAIGQLAGGVAHDFNNLLGGIMMCAEYLGRKLKDKPELRGYADDIAQAVKRGSALTGKLLAFSRKGKIVSTAVDIQLLLREVGGILERSIDKRIELRYELEAENPIVTGDPSLLQSVILNLGINARDAMPEGGRMTLRCGNTWLDEAYCAATAFGVKPGYYVAFGVVDTGVGMDKETMGRIFEPFFTTKEVGKGTGLGLSVVYGTIKDHGGAISVYSEPGKGSEFNVYLPVSGKGDAEIDADKAAVISGSGRVLLVDDEEPLRKTGKAFLEDLGYETLTAADGLECMDVFTANAGNIDMVILDMLMPGMNGRDCFHAIRKIKPSAKVVLCSGFSQSPDIDALFKDGLTGFIKKPFTMAELSQCVAKAMRNGA